MQLTFLPLSARLPPLPVRRPFHVACPSSFSKAKRRSNGSTNTSDRSKSSVKQGTLIRRFDVLAKGLSGHPDSNFVSNLINCLRYGTRVGYLGPLKPRVSRILQSAAPYPDVVFSNLTKEIASKSLPWCY